MSPRLPLASFVGAHRGGGPHVPFESKRALKMAASKFVMDPDFIDVRLEKWYIPLLQSITDKINALASKRSFQRNGGEIMLVGVEGDILYGARTKYEWLALIEDIDRGVKVGVLKHRPKNRRFRFPEDFEEEVSDWAAKKGKHRVAIICSCPSRLGDETAIMEQVRGAGGGEEEPSRRSSRGCVV